MQVASLDDDYSSVPRVLCKRRQHDGTDDGIGTDTLRLRRATCAAVDNRVGVKVKVQLNQQLTLIFPAIAECYGTFAQLPKLV